MAQCGAAGDQSSHLIFENSADTLMRGRRGLTPREEIARKIADAVDDVYPYAQGGYIKTSLDLRHTVLNLNPAVKSPAAQPFYKTDDPPIEMHVVRIGDTVTVTNPFEFYLDYGLRIKARSEATQTFIVQLASGHTGYLPTEKAVNGGGYSAEKYIVTPAGGQTLIDTTVSTIDGLF